jgi:CheY-like chemotaxis protein
MNTLATTWAKKQAGGAQADLQHLAAAVPKSNAPVRVLIAEDNVVNQRVALRLLEKLGIRADVARNGREAVDMLRALPYDVVFMDCQMPGMNGYEAVSEIRRCQGPNQTVPIIAMTAEAFAGSREQCLQAGMDDFITKPVQLEDLAEALGKRVVIRAD